MSFLRKLFPGIFALLLVCMSGPVLAIPLFSEGREAAVVVIPDEATKATRYAAQELIDHLNRATGGTFEIIAESELPAEESRYRISIGATRSAEQRGLRASEMETNHYVILPAREGLYLTGRDDPRAAPPVVNHHSMGSLFAVYDWLDRELSIRWLWPGESGRFIPKRTKLEIEPGTARKGKPAVRLSRFRFYTGYTPEGSDDAPGGSLDDRSYRLGYQWQLRHRVAHPTEAGSFYGHAFGDYWERFGKEHPEWFALRPDGKRGPVDQRTSLVQLCVSNPELHRQIINDWLQNRTPQRPWINGCENDRRAIDPSCRCSACKAWDVPGAVVSVQPNPWHIDSRPPEAVDAYEKVSMSDRYARFLLALLAEGKKHDPDAKVVGYAYSSYSDAPVKVKLNSDVIIAYVPPYIYPLDKGQEEASVKIWEGWKATGATMAYRPNDFLVGYPVPYLYPTQFGRDLSRYLKDGALTTDFDSCIGAWGTQGPNLYLLGRLHARPDLSPEVVMDEYYAAFGAAEGTIRSYVGHWEKVTAQCDSAFRREINGGWAVMLRAAERIFTPVTFAKGRRLLQEAAGQTRSDPEAGARVEYLRVWLEHAQLCTEALRLYRSFASPRPTESQRQQFNRIYQKLMQFRLEHEEQLTGANWKLIRSFEPWHNWKM